MSNKRARLDAPSADPVASGPGVASPTPIAATSGGTGAGAAEAELVVQECYGEEIPEVLFVKMQSDDVEEVDDALCSLGRLLKEDSNVKSAVDLGAHSLVMLVMKKFQYDEDVQANGCGCLQLLAHLNPRAKVSVARAGGMEVLINAMKIFPDSTEVLQYGCGALMNIFADDADDMSPVVRERTNRFVNDLGGLELVVSSMEKFSDDPLVAEYGCGLLRNFACNEEFHSSIKAAGAGRAVGAALDKFSGKGNVKSNGSKFMEYMYT